VIYTVVMFMTD